MSRLECKGNESCSRYGVGFIRICPDWNVKMSIDVSLELTASIRICPDWNVKRRNRTKYTFNDLIRICPDWNVKKKRQASFRRKV